MDRLTVTRSVSTFRGLRMNSCRCSTARFTPRCIAWSEEGGSSPNARLRRAETGNSKYYRFTAKGRRQFLAEESHWKQMAEAVAHVMGPAAEET
jgi:hypothetical protein